MHAPPVQPFSIAGHSIAPGTAQDVSIPVSTMATGYNSHLAVRILHGAKPGPTIFVSGAIHGDEIIGTAIIQRLAHELDPVHLGGTIILIPVSNIFGFISHSRYLPDRRDLNRSFPGNANGSLAGQLANVFFSEVVSRASLGIDIHSAAVHRYNLPQIRIAAGSKRLVELATAFGAPVIIESPLRDGSMRALAKEQGVEMLLLEAGEALRFDDLSIETGTSGVLRVLMHLGMVDPSDDLLEAGAPARSNKTQWVRSTRGGVVHFAKSSGDAVREGDLLATVTGLFGEEPEGIFAPVDGIVIGHATLPVVHQGDALFHIAKVTNPERVGARIETYTDAVLSSDQDEFAEALLDEDEVL
ncbi:succinylglutamate desuccinylase/aspartoacylase family protein [Erythrobacter crassostreae]|uniref:Succinylglutamate desuccinylase/aspartoacylase family protein n=1 Tax=Erythrobacter crassostreae TaxID=2828328 RepID=A0A9X1F7T9_9SPHN|nr:succinylglutamate desuccinylase/aspartoacylase family protein [Erythrobacter crassostrea]MBV7260375.1 succinylglutamate desuccinylase/aspartoacylase family protein [Erythrobacter crassostrea]